ncbi:protein wos2 [Podospora conica]|nr:protein wos2 [Schizothecium conicum]
MAATVTPEVLWAQRSSKVDPEKNFIYLTINVADVSPASLKLDLKPTGLTFTGTSETLKRTYHLELEFFAEIDPTESKIHHTARDVEIKLRKKELDDAYWPRLLKEAKKVHFLKTNFDKWVDEDEQNEAPEEDFSQFGGMGGMPGMGGAGGMGGGDFGGIDFSKLGGGGMPDMGGMGEDDEEDEAEESDDELPGLVEEKPAEAEAKKTEA